MKHSTNTFFLLLILLLTTTACNKDSLKNCEEHTVTDCGEDATKTNIRVRNISEYGFCNVVLNPYNSETNLGIIEAGGNTCYRAFEVAYSYAYVQLFIGEDEFVIQPIDFMEFPLEAGKFTYEIDVVDFERKRLSIEAIAD